MPARTAGLASTLVRGGEAGCDWQAAPASARNPRSAMARVRMLARDFLVSAVFDGEGLRQLSAPGFDIVAVPDDRRIAARVGVNGGGRDVTDVLAHDGSDDLAIARALIREVVERVDQSVHLEVAADGKR